MTNAVYACDLENGSVELHNEIGARSIHYMASHNGNRQSLEVAQTIFLSHGNMKQVEIGSFVKPSEKTIKKRKIVKELSYLNPNEHFCYTIRHPAMNLAKIDPSSAFETEIAKPKTKKFRRKKCVKQNRHEVVNVWKWGGLRFQPEIEPKYDCNVKPNDYVQYLNNPVCDPMFCQLDIADDKWTYNERTVGEYGPITDDDVQVTNAGCIQSETEDSS